MDGFFLFITCFGSLYLLLPLSVIVGLYLAAHHRMADTALLVGGLLGTSLITHVLKLLFARPRPQATELLVTMPADFSFPSAHTSQITAFALSCALIFARQLPAKWALSLWLGLGILVVLVGISRNYLKVHYISDIVAGVVVGAVWIFILRWLLQQLGHRGIG